MGHNHKNRNSFNPDRFNYDKHHIIGKNCKSRAYVEDDTNKMLLSVMKHRALNTLVNDKQNPQEQLGVMYEIWKPVLSNTVRDIIETLLMMERVDFYQSNLIKKKK